MRVEIDIGAKRDEESKEGDGTRVIGEEMVSKEGISIMVSKNSLS